MADDPRKRVSLNAPGDFYVVADYCLRCGLPREQASELMNDEPEYEECYFRRQPQSPIEVEKAIQAICVSEICNLRYGGTNPDIIHRLQELGCGSQCDNAPPTPPEPTPLPKPSWWRRWFGGWR